MFDFETTYHIHPGKKTKLGKVSNSGNGKGCGYGREDGNGFSGNANVFGDGYGCGDMFGKYNGDGGLGLGYIMEGRLFND